MFSGGPGAGFTVGVAWLIMSAISPRKSPIPDSCGRRKGKKETVSNRIPLTKSRQENRLTREIEYDETEFGRVVTSASSSSLSWMPTS